MLLADSRKEYLWSLEDLSSAKHTGQHIANVIDEVIKKVGNENFVAIVSDHGSNVASARRIITEKYPNIINVQCIAHCINLISSDIIKIPQVKDLVRRIHGGELGLGDAEILRRCNVLHHKMSK
jgi:hypothetical protein